MSSPDEVTVGGAPGQKLGVKAGFLLRRPDMAILVLPPEGLPRHPPDQHGRQEPPQASLHWLFYDLDYSSVHLRLDTFTYFLKPAQFITAVTHMSPDPDINDCSEEICGNYEHISGVVNIF